VWQDSTTLEGNVQKLQDKDEGKINDLPSLVSEASSEVAWIASRIRVTQAGVVQRCCHEQMASMFSAMCISLSVAWMSACTDSVLEPLSRVMSS
jgi:hypothetical protein